MSSSMVARCCCTRSTAMVARLNFSSVHCTYMRWSSSMTFFKEASCIRTDAFRPPPVLCCMHVHHHRTRLLSTCKGVRGRLCFDAERFHASSSPLPADLTCPFWMVGRVCQGISLRSEQSALSYLQAHHGTSDITLPSNEDVDLLNFVNLRSACSRFRCKDILLRPPAARSSRSLMVSRIRVSSGGSPPVSAGE